MKKILVLFSIIFSVNLLSIPSYNVTSLSLPKNVDVNNTALQETARVLAGLQLFKDSENPNAYYYVPTFRILPYEEGSGGALLNHRIIDTAEQALQAYNQAIGDAYKDSPWITTELKFLQDHIEKQTKNINDYLANQTINIKISLERLERNFIEDKKVADARIIKLQERISILEEKAIDARLSGDKDLLEYINNLILKKKEEIAEEKQNLLVSKQEIDSQTHKIEELSKEAKLEIKALQDSLQVRSIELIDEYKIHKLKAAAGYLRSIGAPIADDGLQGFDELKKAVSDSLETTDSLSVGLFSMTVYAGFTQAELEAVSRYQALVPGVSITLMPGFNFEFGSNFDLGTQSGLLKSSKIFSGSEGFGAYNGATVTFYLTLAGAKALKLSLDPFIVPLQISAETTFQLQPFTASLKCDFRYGYKINGRTDIVDGAVIFDNDISNTISIQNITGDKNACHLDAKGDFSSARFKALEKLKEQIESTQAKKVELSSTQKQRYYDQMQEDIRNQQAEARYHHDNVDFMKSYMALGLEGLAIEAASVLSDTFWHTRKEDVENITNFHFEEHLSLHESKTQRANWSARLCLKYNAHVAAYVRCTEIENKSADGMTTASDKAIKSTECDATDTIVECGKKRSAAMLQQPNKKDNYQVDNLLFK